MKKDKEWLIQKVSDIFWRVEIDGNFNIQNANIMFDDISNLIDELDEPEKPVIPQFVADWIEEERANIIDWHTDVPERFFLILGHKLHYTVLANTNISDWVFGGNEEKLYQALKYGYEVEKEKKYLVKLPHESDMGLSLYLSRQFGVEWVDEETMADHITEAEIKAIDERYWAFAEEVKG